MRGRISESIKRYAIASGWVYFTILFGWLALYLLNVDHFRLIGLVNSLAVYLFLPLPLIALIAIFTQRKELIGSTILGVVVFMWFWGALFVPRLRLPNREDSLPALTVMSYNVLGLHNFTDPIIDVIQEQDADVVCLQEVNPGLATALRTELIKDYPYQITDPHWGVQGMATISRFPIQLEEEQIPMNWIGVPQVIEMDFEGKRITLVNFHTYPHIYRSESEFQSLNEGRQSQAQILADFARETRTPLILAGDANDTSLSETYRIIINVPLKDAWHEAGLGLGHTYPGSDLPGSSRPHFGDWYSPQWITRIDYVFVSPHWEVRSARLARFDGVSDHRGVVAEIILSE